MDQHFYFLNSVLVTDFLLINIVTSCNCEFLNDVIATATGVGA